MREANFLRQNQARWQAYEDAPATNPDELAARFVSLTDDLAYAQTYYPHSPTTTYLNQLTGRLHQSLYKNKPEQQNRLGRFWAVEVPLVVARHQQALAWSAALFVLFVLLGMLSSAYDLEFSRLVLGDYYVNMTLDNIRRGDPMAVYKHEDQADMFVTIAMQNLKVSFMTFAAGITLGLGTLVILFENGVMVGTFQYFFYQHHALKASLLGIWIHGMLEVPGIVIEGAAGFILAGGVLFPGTHSRREALALAARDALKLSLGMVPIIVTAAFLEGFVTRLTDMPVVGRLAIILGSAAFMIWYFGIYPRQVQRRALAAADVPPTPAPADYTAAALATVP